MLKLEFALLAMGIAVPMSEPSAVGDLGNARRERAVRGNFRGIRAPAPSAF